MAGSARSAFTRLLPWAALALMAVMFFVQVAARRSAEDDAARARDALHAARAGRPADPAPEPTSPPAPEASAAAVAELASAHESERAALQRRLEDAQEALDGARRAHAALRARAERTEALRVTQTARAEALEAQRAAEAAAAATRVADLEAALAEARRLLERRRSPVALWFEAWRDGDAAARTALRTQLAKAASDDVAELAVLWQREDGGERADVFLGLLGAMPVTPASAALAAEIIACEPGMDADALRPWVALAGPQLLDADVFVALLAAPHPSLHGLLVAHAEGAPAAWGEAERARVAAALAERLAAKDAPTVRFGLSAITRLALPVAPARVLPLLDHADASVRIAAIYYLLRRETGAPAATVLGPYVARLLDDEAFDIRMAGLFLAQELVGEKRSLAFGSSQEAVAQEIARLKRKLAALATGRGD